MNGSDLRMSWRARDFTIFATFALFCAAAVVAVVHVDNQTVLLCLLAALVAIWAVAARFGVVGAIEQAAATSPWWTRLTIAAACAVVLGALHDDNFGLLMVATVLLYVTVCVGLTIQVGYIGLSNFSAAAFFGCGGYTAAVFDQSSWRDCPSLLVIFAGGIVAAAIGLLLILPVLRTRGHYAALTTLAFGELFAAFLNVNDLLGGPQGLKLTSINLFGWDFSNDIQTLGIDFSFYTNYALLSLLLASAAVLLAGLLDRSWIGIWFDAVRLDETAAGVYGLKIARLKVLAFTIGNLLAGLAGAVYAKMIGFIAPTNFTLSDSLVMLSIVILGGIGNRWGVFPAALIVILLPEKLQFIQEYRLLLFAIVVIAILVLSPGGLLPRRTRRLVRDVVS